MASHRGKQSHRRQVTTDVMQKTTCIMQPSTSPQASRFSPCHDAPHALSPPAGCMAQRVPSSPPPLQVQLRNMLHWQQTHLGRDKHALTAWQQGASHAHAWHAQRVAILRVGHGRVRRGHRRVRVGHGRVRVGHGRGAQGREGA